MASSPFVLLSLLTSSSTDADSLRSLPDFLAAFSADPTSTVETPSTAALLATDLGKAHATALGNILDVCTTKAAEITVSYMSDFVSKGGFYSDATSASAASASAASASAPTSSTPPSPSPSPSPADDFKSISPSSSPISTLPFLRLCIHHFYDSEVYAIKTIQEMLRIDLDDSHPLKLVVADSLTSWLSPSTPSDDTTVNLLIDRIVKNWSSTTPPPPSLPSSIPPSLFLEDYKNLDYYYEKSKNDQLDASRHANTFNTTTLFEVRKFMSVTAQQTLSQTLQTTTHLLNLLSLLFYSRVSPTRKTLLSLTSNFLKVSYFSDHPAFHRNSTAKKLFPPGSENGRLLRRLPMIAAVITIESFQFWRLVPPNSNENPLQDCVLLEGENVEAELSSVHDTILNESIPLLEARLAQLESTDDANFVAPESILALSWALWMRLVKFYLASNSRSGSSSELLEFFASRDSETLETANKYSAFTYLKTVASALNSDNAFASICKECISATIASCYLFTKTAMPPTDVEVLCTLSSAAYKNQTNLCEQFWAQFGAFSYFMEENGGNLSVFDAAHKFDPLCHLLNSANDLSTSSLKSPTLDVILARSRPLIELLSHLATDEETAAFAIRSLPPNSLHLAVKQCSLSLHDNCGDENTIVSLYEALSQLTTKGGRKSRESLTALLTLSGPRYIFNAAVNAASSAIATSALNALSNLSRFGCIKNWPMTVSRCVANNGGARFLLNAPIDCVVAGVRLFHQLSLHASTVFVDQAETDGLQYLQTLLDGIERTCDILGAINERLSFDNCSDRWGLTSMCIQNIDAFLKSLRPYTRASNLSSNTVATICKYRDIILHRLVSDGRVSREIAMCSTLPVASAVRGTLAISNELTQTKTENKAWGAWSLYAGESTDANTSGEMPFRKLDFSLGVLGTIDGAESAALAELATKSLQLLLTWFEESESSGGSHTPLNLLTVPPPKPPASLSKFEGGNDFVYSDTDLNATWKTATTLGNQNFFDKMTTIDFIAYYVTTSASEFASSLVLPTGDAISLLRWSMRFGIPVMEILGANKHEFSCLHCVIDAAVCNKESHCLVDDCVNFLNLLEDSIRYEPEFALKFLNSPNVVDSLVNCLDVEDFAADGNVDSNLFVVDEENAEKGVEEGERGAEKAKVKISNSLRLSARAVSTIAFLWEARGVEGEIFATTEKIRAFGGNAFLEKMTQLLQRPLEWSALGGGSSSLSNHTHKIKLVSGALRILTIEIHSEEKICSVVEKFLANAAAKNQYEEWTEQFMVFSDDVFDEMSENAEPRVVFDRVRTIVSPAAFLSGLISLDDKVVYDVKCASDFFSISRSDGEEAVVSCLTSYNTIWSLASAEATLIRSWRRFMEVCVLRSEVVSKEGEHSGGGGGGGGGGGNERGGRGGGFQTPQFSPKSRRKRSSSGDSFEPPPLSLPPTPGGIGSSPGGGNISNFLGDFRSHAMVNVVVKALANNNNYNNSTIGSFAFAIVASEMAEALVSMLHHQLHVVVKKSAVPGKSQVRRRDNSRLYEPGECLNLLNNIELATDRLFKVTEPVRGGITGGTLAEVTKTQEEAFDMASRVRLRLLTAAMLIIRALARSGGGGGEDVKLRLLERVCDTITLLRCMGYGEGAGGGRACLIYDFEEEEDDGRGRINLDLLKTSIAVLTALLPGRREGGDYCQRFANVLHNHNLYSSLVHHVDASSMSGNLQVVKALMSFFHLSACSCSELAVYLSQSGIHQTLNSNNLLRSGCLRWGGGEKLNFGYVKSGGGGNFDDFETDPILEIFGLAVKTASALLRNRARGISREDDEQHSEYNLELALDFITTYSSTINSVLVHSPRHNVKYTLNSLKTASECLELVGLCIGVNMGRFRQSAGNLLDVFLAVCRDIVVDVSSFLGSSVVSRFLFKPAGEGIGRGGGGGGNRNRTLSSQVQHEAIAHSHYISTSTYAMSNSERALLCSTDGCGGYSNLFAYKIENFLGEVLLSALTVIAKANPREDKFVYFTLDEAGKLGSALTSLLCVGGLVGVREEGLSFALDFVGDGDGDGVTAAGGLTMGTVLNVYDNDTFDIRFEGGEVATGLATNRIGCIQDSTKQSPSFDFAALGSSAADFRGSKMCLGHLGLALKWCAEASRGGGLGQGGVEVESVRLLAERAACLMASEISLWGEAGVYKVSKEVWGWDGDGDDDNVMMDGGGGGGGGWGEAPDYNGSTSNGVNNANRTNANELVNALLFEIFFEMEGEMKNIIRGDDVWERIVKTMKLNTEQPKLHQGQHQGGRQMQQMHQIQSHQRRGGQQQSNRARF